MKDIGWFDVSRCDEPMHLIARNDAGYLALFHVDETECENCEYDLTEIAGEV